MSVSSGNGCKRRTGAVNGGKRAVRSGLIAKHIAALANLQAHLSLFFLLHFRAIFVRVKMGAAFHLVFHFFPFRAEALLYFMFLFCPTFRARSSGPLLVNFD